MPGFNLRGQATGQIIADNIKTVKDRNNALLFLNRRHWQIYLSQSFAAHMRNACATLHTVQFYFFILKHIVQIFWYGNFFLYLIPKAIRNKYRFIPVRNKSSRCTASSHCDNFTGVVSTVNIICRFLPSQNHGDITSFFIFLSDILTTKNICNLTQRQHGIAKHILQELNQCSALLCSALLCSALLCSAQNCVTSFCKCQELISVIFILFLSCFNLCGQTNVEVGANLLKVVQHIYNAVLDIEGW